METAVRKNKNIPEKDPKIRNLPIIKLCFLLNFINSFLISELSSFSSLPSNFSTGSADVLECHLSNKYMGKIRDREILWATSSVAFIDHLKLE
jgi:hypothetical protein